MRRPYVILAALALALWAPMTSSAQSIRNPAGQYVGTTGTSTNATIVKSGAGVALVNGDILAAVGSGNVSVYSPSGTLVGTENDGNSGFTTGMCFDPTQTTYLVTNFSTGTLTQWNVNGNLNNASFISGQSEPESCAYDKAGDVYVGDAGLAQINKYSSSGTLLQSYSVQGGNGTGGTDWVDLAADQCTILYDGEGTVILSYNVCTNTQNAPFATVQHYCYALRIRPNGEVMVACSDAVLRLSPTGAVLQTYTLGNGALFALNLSADNSTFYTGDFSNGTVYHVDIATGTILGQFNTCGNLCLFGLALYPELRVGSGTGGGGTGTGGREAIGTGCSNTPASANCTLPSQCAGMSCRLTVSSSVNCVQANKCYGGLSFQVSGAVAERFTATSFTSGGFTAFSCGTPPCGASFTLAGTGVWQPGNVTTTFTATGSANLATKQDSFSMTANGVTVGFSCPGAGGPPYPCVSATVP